MRPGIIVAAAVALVLVAVPAGGHGEEEEQLGHLSVRSLELAPGQSESQTIDPASERMEPWRAGMVFTYYAMFFTEEPDLNVQLSFAHNVSVAEWNLTGEARHYRTARIPFDDGPYELVLTNRAETTAQFMFFFDQTCDCTQKLIALPGGFVVFHYDLKRGTEYRVGFPLIRGWELEGQVATLTNESAEWPTGFHVGQEATATGPGWLNFTVEPDRDQRYYFFLFERAGVTADPTGRPVPIRLTPLIETTRDAPAPAVALMAAAVLALAVALRRR